MASSSTELQVAGRKVRVTNLEKPLFPAVGFTKGQIIDYYIRISHVVLPHLKDRPATLKRYPDGVQAEHFYEKEAPAFTPKWVETAKVWRVSGQSQIRYVLLNDLPSLVWATNLANIELHTLLARAPKIEQPTMMVFDLDPGEPAGLLDCAQVALWLKELLQKAGLQGLVKASGSKGLHFHVPLNTAVTYEQTQPLAKAVAELLERQHPDVIVSQMAKELRRGKVFIDWSQNAPHKSTVCPYSLRAKHDRPFVAMPLQWDEVEHAVAQHNDSGFWFNPEQAIARCDRSGDLFESLLALEQTIPKELAQELESQPAVVSVPASASVPRRAARGDLSIKAYRAKRDFSRTREPAPSSPTATQRKSVVRAAGSDRPRLFVIQKHAASRLHYDFRLEMEGVLKSWAVPKGVPYDRAEKRLAMQVEDHPLDYARFEGTIAPGNYGAGTVMVWDIGTYEVMDGNLYSGKLHLRLTGKKLKGEWILVRPARNDEAKPAWFLIKGGTSLKRLSAKRDDTSALTGRSMAQIAHSNDAQWISNRPAQTRAPAAPKKELEQDIPAVLKDCPKAAPKFIPPMQAKLTAALPHGSDWIFEIKFDGYRALAIKRGRAVELRSRNNKPLEFGSIAAALKKLSPKSFALDGEVVAVDSAGRPDFQALQNRRGPDEQQLSFYVFDVLNYEGKDVTSLPLRERKRILSDTLAEAGHPIHFSAEIKADTPEALVAAVRAQGLEGIVAKQLEAPYQSGERSGAWLKYKTDCGQEFVVGGYRTGQNKQDFDALVLGYYDGAELRYAGKLKNGFTPRDKRQILSAAAKLKLQKPAFKELPVGRGGRWGEGLTDDDLKHIVWLKPKIVVEVSFVEWTNNGILRHSRFKAIREDKAAREVVREST